MSENKYIEQKGIMLNITSHDEHVPEIKRFIRMVKERVWDIVNTLPLEQYPNILIVKTVYNEYFGSTAPYIETEYIRH